MESRAEKSLKKEEKYCHWKGIGKGKGKAKTAELVEIQCILDQCGCMSQRPSFSLQEAFYEHLRLEHEVGEKAIAKIQHVIDVDPPRPSYAKTIVAKHSRGICEVHFDSTFENEN